MANPNKQQGTRYEGDTRDFHNDQFPGVAARRIEEGGMYDVGDVVFNERANNPVVVEAKARQVLQVHRTLAKTKRKADSHRVAVFWKRLTNQGKKNRQPVDGQAEVVILDPEFYAELMDAWLEFHGPPIPPYNDR